MPTELQRSRSADTLAASSPEAGQVAIPLVLILGLFLLGVLGFAVDLTNMWFHRQTAVAAADAACQAGAMDLLSTAAGATPSAPGFTAGTASNCVSSPSATMCTYAKDNGYTATGLNASAASSAVSWTFPSSVAGVSAGAGAYPFLQLTLVENVKAFFMPLVTHKQYQEVAVTTTCGIAQVLGPAPMIVLAPSGTAFTYSGGAGLKIVGGPVHSLQINSTSSTSVNYSPSGKIDLSLGGPNETGSDASVSGANPSPQSSTNIGFNGGSTGQWIENALPIPNPYASVPAPKSMYNQTPTLGVKGTHQSNGTDGCTDTANGCTEYSPGYYPSGITGDGYHTMIFDPGIYYMGASLTVGGSNTMRMAKLATTKQTDGIMFYFAAGSIEISGASGGPNSNPAVQPTALTCDGSQPNSALGMTSSNLTGNILWAQCTTNGTYWDSGNDTKDAVGSIRGLLVFQAATDTTSPSFTGSGSLGFSGSLYFHNSSYTDNFTINGAGTTGTFILGDIVTDQVTLSGSGTINLALNPTPSVEMSKVGVFQ